MNMKRAREKTISTKRVKEEIVNEIGRLDYGNQKRVLDFVKAIAVSGRKGVHGKKLLSFAGIIPPEDLDEMRNAIEEN